MVVVLLFKFAINAPGIVHLCHKDRSALDKRFMTNGPVQRETKVCKRRFVN